MNKILSFTTLLNEINIVFHRDDEIIMEKHIVCEKQSELLISSIEDVLNENNLNYSDIDIFSSIIGPGNFTSIKTSLTVLKMLKITTNKNIITNNLFEIFSYKNFQYDIFVLDLGYSKYYIYDVVNNSYNVIYKANFFLDENKHILTNDLTLKGKNIRYAEFKNQNWVNLIYDKSINKIYNNDITALYIENAVINKRKK